MVESSGLVLDDGVVCGEFCRAEGTIDVFAAGDVARWFSVGGAEHRRVEHWTNAAEQATCVAYNICHPDEMKHYDPVDYVWSDQHDWRIQIAGRTGDCRGYHLETFRNPRRGQFLATYADGAGRLVGAVTINWPKAMVTVRRMLVAGGDVADARTALYELVRVTAPSRSDELSNEVEYRYS
ncbi:MAG TPA: oxidoreductase C-terminal domain-containing protein [Mycobacterium sp.]|nr:oxidoreductase C-terminal domain-containing protein [Mycobacterium sp.]